MRAGLFGSGVALITSLEAGLTAVGRLLDMAHLPTEAQEVQQRPDDGPVPPHPKPACTGSTLRGMLTCCDGNAAPRNEAAHEWSAPQGWPSGGTVVFDAVTAAYTWKSAPAIRRLSVTIPSGSSCAFVGRSGSGKSTSVLALTGMIPITEGARVGGRSCGDGASAGGRPWRRGELGPSDRI